LQNARKNHKKARKNERFLGRGVEIAGKNAQLGRVKCGENGFLGGENYRSSGPT